MNSLFFRGIRNNKGQSTVEFALVLPILLLIVFGIIEFGFIFNAYVTVVSSAREGARFGIVGGKEEGEIKQRVKDSAGMLKAENFGEITAVIEDDKLTVFVPYDVEVLDPIMGAILGDKVPISAKVTMAME